ncbi:hypothetical protein CEQ90_06810 [Lewinellaceae bacterium SD302]|nr:hypothetical protein CEQ90_06810 [Lewinellaceae bacterium SD302]
MINLWQNSRVAPELERVYISGDKCNNKLILEVGKVAEFSLNDRQDKRVKSLGAVRKTRLRQF